MCGLYATEKDSIGNQLSHIAIGWQIYELTSSPLHLGLTGAFRALPVVVCSLTGAVSGNTLAQFRRAWALIGEAHAVDLWFSIRDGRS